MRLPILEYIVHLSIPPETAYETVAGHYRETGIAFQHAVPRAFYGLTERGRGRLKGTADTRIITASISWENAQ